MIDEERSYIQYLQNLTNKVFVRCINHSFFMGMPVHKGEEFEVPKGYVLSNFVVLDNYKKYKDKEYGYVIKS